MKRSLLVGLLLLPLTCFSASSGHVLIEQNCRAWAQVAKVVMSGKNQNLTKEQVLGAVKNQLAEKGSAQKALDEVMLNMGKMWDEQPKGRNPDEMYNATYLACWTRAEEQLRAR